MAKLYFKYGAMNASKSANALMTRFDYIKKGYNVLLMKPKVDTRSAANEITSRVGLSAPCYAFSTEENLLDFFEKENKLHKIKVVIVDECQFCTKKQIDELRDVTAYVPVICYGLKTNFKTQLFEGSKRLLELADSVQEIKSVCDCGNKAILNGRFNNGVLVSEGEEIQIGGNESYKGLCYFCYKKEEERAKVYTKIIKYLDIFKDKTCAGNWSSDTALDNIVLQKPFVIYDEDVRNFIKDFKNFHFQPCEEVVLVGDSLKEFQKISMKGKSFDYVMTLIHYVLKIEEHRPGFLKALIEDGTITKWLKQIKKAVDSQ